jgi:site-specific recombinase XerD
VAAKKPPSNRGKTFPPQALTREEVRALLKACSRKSPTGARNAAIVATLWRSGIRCSELLQLRWRDVDVAGEHLQVRRGKGGKHRVIAIDGEAIARIDLWMAKRKELGISKDRPLFCTLEGGTLSSRYVRALLPRLAAKAGIEKRCHPHGLRHSLAYEMVQNNLPLTIIQRQLGHSNAAVTSRYLQHVNPGELLDAMRTLPPWDTAVAA